MIYVTGDTHGNFCRIEDFCDSNKLKNDDILIILGDVGLNYYLGKKDRWNKDILKSKKNMFICIHGNHEMRPQEIESYKIINNEFGKFYYEEAYPNILFCIDGEIYNIYNHTFLCLGGAYSVDKYYRLQRNLSWFESEQMNKETQTYVRENLFGKKFDFILSHTCPFKYIPREMFLTQIDQTTVDNSMEYFLDECEENIEYDHWLCGHWHTDKIVDKIRFLFNGVISI